MTNETGAMIIPGNVLAEVRSSAGWSQSELGHELEVTRSAVAQWERRGIDAVKANAVAGLLIRRGLIHEAAPLLAALTRPRDPMEQVG